MSIQILVYGWRYRVRQDGLVESQNKFKKEQWAVRQSTATGISDNHYAWIRDTLRQGASQFPKDYEPLPTTKEEPPSVPVGTEQA